MFLPAILLKDADLLVRYVAAVVSVSSVLFFSASIPCILATRIPVSVGQLVVIWLLRTLLGILLAALCGRLALALGWLVDQGSQNKAPSGALFYRDCLRGDDGEPAAVEIIYRLMDLCLAVHDKGP